MTREEMRERVALLFRTMYATEADRRMAADAAIALVLEEAAKVAEFRIGCDEWSADTNSGYECASREIAAAIRALRDKP